MIFPPESIHEFRHELARSKWTLARSDRRRLSARRSTVDPHDPAATRSLALTAEDGRRPRHRRRNSGAAAIAPTRSRTRATWCWAASCPIPPWPPHMRHSANRSCTSIPRRTPICTPTTSRKRRAPSDAEPEAVTRELEPHRLLHELFVAGLDADRRLADRSRSGARLRLRSPAARRSQRLWRRSATGYRRWTGGPRPRPAG